MPNPDNPRRIFVVDDESAIASSLNVILRNEGFNVAYFTDPLKALEAVNTEPPDLLITEVVMARFSGIELAIKLQEMCPECKVLLYSGEPLTAQLLEDARAEGHDFDVLPKPVHPTVLLEKIRSVFGLGSDETGLEIRI